MYNGFYHFCVGNDDGFMIDSWRAGNRENEILICSGASGRGTTVGISDFQITDEVLLNGRRR